MLSRLFNSQVLVATEERRCPNFLFHPARRLYRRQVKTRIVLYNKNVMISYLQDYLVSLISFTPCAGTENETELFLISIDSFFHKSVM